MVFLFVQVLNLGRLRCVTEAAPAPVSDWACCNYPAPNNTRSAPTRGKNTCEMWKKKSKILMLREIISTKNIQENSFKILTYISNWLCFPDRQKAFRIMYLCTLYNTCQLHVQRVDAETFLFSLYHFLKINELFFTIVGFKYVSK